MAMLDLFGQLLHSRQPVTMRTMLLLGCAGLAVGSALGYMAMGTLHALLEFGVETHYTPGAAPLTPRATKRMTQQLNQNRLAQQMKQRSARALIATKEATSRNTKEASSSKPDRDQQPRWPRQGSTVHTLCTSNGSPYTNVQTRIMYATYRLAQKAPGGELLAAFTRILHRTHVDELMQARMNCSWCCDAMQEVPTFHAQPLTPKCDTWCEFPVSDRPNTVRQFFTAAAADAGLIKAPWLLLIETDYVWMAPLAGVPRAESSAKGWGFPYGYIQPTHPNIKAVMQELYPASQGPLSDIPNTGPAPVLLRGAEWQQVIPDWERLTAAIEGDSKAKEGLGWVREMYAFSIACALQGVHLDLKLPPNSPLMAQPPADHRRGAAALLHYTWGTIIHDAKQNNSEVWQFDKRAYTARQHALQVPQFPEPPQWREGLTLQDGVRVTADLIDILTTMIQRMNAATKDLPALQSVA